VGTLFWDFDTPPPPNNIENGPRDAIALVDDLDNVLYFISYEGVCAAADGYAIGMTSVDIGVSENGSTPEGESLQLIGTGSGYEYFDWTGPVAESPGSLNSGQFIDSFFDITYTDLPDFPPLCGDVIRSWVVSDACGNSWTGDQTITIFDDEGPVITPPANITVECNTSTDPSVTGQATATDDCDPAPVVTYDDNITPGSCPQEFVITRTWTAEDACGNTSTGDQTITVDDSTPPVINPLANDLTVQCDGSGNLADLLPWLFTNAGAFATDACSSVTWSNNYTSLSDDCGETGSALVIFTATDECGNASTTSATFTIIDDTPPDINCPADVPLECIEEMVNYPAAIFYWEFEGLGGSFGDDCSDDNDIVFEYVGDNQTGSCPTIITRTYRVTDDCGNTNTCEQTFTILDVTDPFLIDPGEDCSSLDIIDVNECLSVAAG